MTPSHRRLPVVLAAVVCVGGGLVLVREYGWPVLVAAVALVVAVLVMRRRG